MWTATAETFNCHLKVLDSASGSYANVSYTRTLRIYRNRVCQKQRNLKNHKQALTTKAGTTHSARAEPIRTTRRPHRRPSRARGPRLQLTFSTFFRASALTQTYEACLSESAVSWWHESRVLGLQAGGVRESLQLAFQAQARRRGPWVF